MADEEQLGIIKDKGVRAWNSWRRENYSIIPDLRCAEFQQAYLFQADFSNVNLYSANFKGAFLLEAQLRLANLESANLEWAKLRNIALEESILMNANLKEADCSESNFRDANLRGADLRGAILRETDIGRSQCLGTNFSHAVLTGACIEDWNINSQTNLDNVVCDYVYLGRGQQERRPSDPTKNFELGEFAKLVQKSVETVDLIFLNGIDWQSFLQSFQDLQVEGANGQLAIQAIERKTGGAFVVRVEVPPYANKASLEASFWEKYNPLLEAKDREIKLLSQQTEFYFREVEFIRTDNTRLLGIIETMAEKGSAKYDLRGAKFGGGFAADGGTQSGGTFNDYSITIGQNIDDIERLISSLRENIQHFPEEQREDAEMELEDLEEEIKNPEKLNPKRFKKIIKGLLAAGGTATIVASGAVDVSENINQFTDNVTELGEKLEVPIEYIRGKLEN